MLTILVLIIFSLILVLIFLPNSIDLDEKLYIKYGILKYNELDNLYQLGLDEITLTEDEVREYINMVNTDDKVSFQIAKLPSGRYAILQKFGRKGKFRIMHSIHSNSDPSPIEFTKPEIAMAYCDELAIRQYPRTRRLAGSEFK